MSLAPTLLGVFRAGAGTRSWSRGLLLRRMSSLAQKLSTVHVGTAFEERSCMLLRQTMSMALTRVGGKDDEGVDLLGWWWLPNALETTTSDASVTANSNSDDATTNSTTTTSTSDASTTNDAPPRTPASEIRTRSRIRILAQCKAESKKMGPAYVRELEGVLFRSLASDPSPLVGLLISQSAFTKAAVLRAQSSPIPMLLLHLPAADGDSEEAAGESESTGASGAVKNKKEKKKDQEADTKPPIGDDPGAFGGALCNPALMRMRNVRGWMEIRWERRLGGMGGRPALWWDGDRLSSQIPEPGEPHAMEGLPSA